MSEQASRSDVVAAPTALASPAAVMGRAGGENFPVAARLLPRRYRTHLLAIYGFARLADTIGDESSGDRLAELEWLDAELDRAAAGRAMHGEPVHAAVVPGIVARIADHLAQAWGGPADAGRWAVDAALWRVVRHGLGVDAPPLV